MTTLGRSDNLDGTEGRKQMSGSLNRMMLMFKNTNALGGTQGNQDMLLQGGGGTTSTQGKMGENSDEDDGDIQYDDEEDEYREPPGRRYRGDSPDFNRGEEDDKSNLTSTTYDLTVSANNAGH
jgi:hypothetical protein